MPIKYRVLPNQNLLFGVFSGMLTPSEYLRGIEELSGNPEFKSNFDRLGILHKSLDLSHFAFEDIIKIKEKWPQLITRANSRMVQAAPFAASPPYWTRRCIK